MARVSCRRPQRTTGYGRLHLQMHSRYNEVMSTTIVGFAVADEDQERLSRLVEHFGGGNRSAYLRATLPVTESLAARSDWRVAGAQRRANCLGGPGLRVATGKCP